MTPRDIIKAGVQYVTYNVFVTTLAILIGLGGSIFGAASWIYNRDQQAAERLETERWLSHSNAEVIRDRLIQTQLESMHNDMEVRNVAINEKLDDIREAMRK